MLINKTSYWSSSSVVIVLLHKALLDYNFEIFESFEILWKFDLIFEILIFFYHFEIFWKFEILRNLRNFWNFEIY
jgi:hypothetical protein